MALDNLKAEVIARDGDVYTVSWQSPEQITVTASLDSNVITNQGATKSGVGRIEFVTNESRRVYFHLLAEGRSLGVTAERCLLPQSSSNFRDMGGYRAADGNQVAWGRLYRSGRLSGLSPKDGELWQSLSIGKVIDFRSEKERQYNPSYFPGEFVPEVVELEITAGNTAQILRELAAGKGSEVGFVATMVDINRHFVVEQADLFREFFSLIADSDSGVLFHCSAGKDRTGFAAALLLTALGVSYGDVMADYLLTRQYFIPKQEFEWFSGRYDIADRFEDVKPILEVRPDYLNAAFDAMREECGSVDVYLTEKLGVDESMRAVLRARFLV